MTDYSREAAFAIEAVSLACEVAARVRQEMVKPAFTKEDQSPVTVADFAVQALIAKLLNDHFPQDALVGEEDAANLKEPSSRTILERIEHFLNPVLPDLNAEKICFWIQQGAQEPAKRFWTLDPIDGTKGFIRGDHYAVALALIEEGEVKVGVLGCPHFSSNGALAVAVHGRGAQWKTLSAEKQNWQPLKVSSRKSFSEAVLLRSFEKKHVDSPRMKSFIDKLGIQAPPILMDSLTKYLALAIGEGDILLRFPMPDHPYEWIWDQAAGVIMVEEAGGRVTDLDGKKFDFSQGKQLKANRGVLVSNGRFHSEVLEVLKQIDPA